MQNRLERFKTKYMELTDKEKDICKRYSTRDKQGYVHCLDCPLRLPTNEINTVNCYAIIDGRTKEAKELKRFI